LARYRILSWRDIPAQVQATDDTGARANRETPAWFGQEIDRIAMREGLAGSDEYTAQFAWSKATERAGTADEAVDAVLAELVADWAQPD
jgi:Virulence factor